MGCLATGFTAIAAIFCKQSVAQRGARLTNPEQANASLLQPVRTSRNFTALWLGQTASQFGDSILWITLPQAVYSATHSTMQMGVVMALITLPLVVLLPFTGILVDRFSRITLMILSDSIRSLLVTALAFLSAMHHLSFTLLDVAVVLYGAMDAVFQPAYAAARAQVFTSDIRNSANALTQISGQFARLLGPALGGLLVGFGSVAAGFATDAVALACSVVSLLFLHVPAPKRKLTADIGLRHFVRELAGGFYALREHPWLWVTICVFAFINIGTGGVTAIILPWLIKVHLSLPFYAYGLVSSAGGVGALLGAVLLGRQRQLRRRGLIAYGGVALAVIATLGYVFVAWLPGLLLLSGLTGLGIMAFGLVWEGSMQELVPEEAYGRASSLDMFGSFALLPLGNLLTGWLAARNGGISTIFWEGSVMLAITLLALSVPAIRHFD